MEKSGMEYKLVFNAGVARNLLKRGCVISDIKADRSNKDKTIFVFDKTPEFEKVFSEINEEIKRSKNK